MVASKMRNKVYLRNLKRRHFEQYVDYILGEKCYNMKVPTATGERSALQPPWHILLDYEYEMRSHAFKKALLWCHRWRLQVRSRHLQSQETLHQ